METIFLKNDGRCKWIENNVFKKHLPRLMNTALDPNQKKIYLIEDWISNESGGGVNVSWLKQAGIPMIKSYRDLPEGNNFSILNTAYDAIPDEEKLLLAKNIDYIDEPCPHIRKLREIFETSVADYQYVLLCKPNHIIIKNFKSLFPKDMILVQMNNYKEEILSRQNGKPLILVPYVTFLSSNIECVFRFINERFPERRNKVLNTSCGWVHSPSISPIVEINNMEPKELEGVNDALLIIAPGSMNPSVDSLTETLAKKGLNVIKISSLREFIAYERKNRKSRVLLVRSPIPNNAEKRIITYIKSGLIVTCYEMITSYLGLQYSKIN